MIHDPDRAIDQWRAARLRDLERRDRDRPPPPRPDPTWFDALVAIALLAVLGGPALLLTLWVLGWGR